MRRIRLVLVVALAMVALLLAASPAMAQTWWDDGDRGNLSDNRDWNDRNNNWWDNDKHNNWWWRPHCDWFWSWWWGWQHWCWSPWWGWYISWW